MRLQDGDCLLLIGDSSTDCGRGRPVGTGTRLGDGYVAMVNSLLAAWYPGRRIHVLNTGVSGNRVTDLVARWQRDVLDLNPDWLPVMIGISDVWRRFDSPFEARQAQGTGAGDTLLCRARPIRSDAEADGRPRQGGEAAGRRAGAVLVDVQAAFDRALAHRTAEALCDDGVHVNRSGHTAITRAWLTAIGFDWGRGVSA